MIEEEEEEEKEEEEIFLTIIHLQINPNDLLV